MTRSRPPRSQNCFSSFMRSRMPLHFMNDTRISIRSADRISALSSCIRLGSSVEPVKRLLCESGVTGREERGEDMELSSIERRISPSLGIVHRLRHSSFVIVAKRRMISLQQAICSGTVEPVESSRNSSDFLRIGSTY